MCYHRFEKTRTSNALRGFIIPKKKKRKLIFEPKNGRVLGKGRVQRKVEAEEDRKEKLQLLN